MRSLPGCSRSTALVRNTAPTEGNNAGVLPAKAARLGMHSGQQEHKGREAPAANAPLPDGRSQKLGCLAAKEPGLPARGVHRGVTSVEWVVSCQLRQNSKSGRRHAPCCCLKEPWHRGAAGRRLLGESLPKALGLGREAPQPTRSRTQRGRVHTSYLCLRTQAKAAVSPAAGRLALAQPSHLLPPHQQLHCWVEHKPADIRAWGAAQRSAAQSIDPLGHLVAFFFFWCTWRAWH